MTISRRKRWLGGAALLLLLVPWGVWRFYYDGADPRLILRPPPPDRDVSAVWGQPVSLHVEDQLLRDVLQDLGDRYGLEVVIDEENLEREDAYVDVPVTLHADDQRLHSVLNSLAEQVAHKSADDKAIDYSHALFAGQRGDRIVLTSHAKWRFSLENYTTRVYRIDALQARSTTPFNEAAMAQVLRNCVVPITWYTPLSNKGYGEGRIEILPGALLVRQTPEVHREIGALLDALANAPSGETLGETILVSPEDFEHLDVDLRLYPLGEPLRSAMNATELLHALGACQRINEHSGYEGLLPGAACLDGVLIVRQTAETHRRIELALAKMRNLLAPDRFPPLAGPCEQRLAAKTAAILEEQTDRDLSGMSLREALRRLAQTHHVRIEFDQPLLAGTGAFLDEPIYPDSISRMPLKHALERMLRDWDCTYVVRGDAIWITAKGGLPWVPRFYRVPSALRARVGPGWSDVFQPMFETEYRPGGVIDVRPCGEIFVAFDIAPVHDEIELFLANVETALALGRPPTSSIDVLATDALLERRALEKLAQRTSVDVRDQPLADVVRMLAERHDAPIIADVPGLESIGFSADMPVKLSAADVTLHDALQRIASPFDLEVFVDRGVIEMTAPEAALWRRRPRLYFVSDLLAEQPHRNGAALIEALAATTGRGHWRRRGHGRMSERSHCLVVHTTVDFRGRIDRLLAALRRPYPSDGVTPVEIAGKSGEPEVHLYPVADLLQRFDPPQEVVVARIHDVQRNRRKWGPAWRNQLRDDRRPPRLPGYESWAKTFAQQLVDAVLTLGGNHPDQENPEEEPLTIDAAVFGDYLCVRTETAEHLAVERLLAALRAPAPESLEVNSLGDAREPDCFCRSYDVRPCLRAFPELDVEQLRAMVLRATTPYRWREPPLPFSSESDSSRGDIAALPSLLIVRTDAQGHEAVEMFLRRVIQQAQTFPRPTDLHRDDNSGAVTALAHRLRAANSLEEMAWWAVLAAQVEPTGGDPAEVELVAAVAEHLQAAHVQGDVDLMFTLCHALANLGIPATEVIDELTSEIAGERDEQRLQMLYDTLLALGVQGRAMTIARLSSADANEKADENTVREANAILACLARCKSPAADTFPVLIELLYSRYRDQAGAALQNLDPQYVGSLAYVHNQLAEPQLTPAEQAHFQQLLLAVYACRDRRLSTLKRPG